MKRHSFFIKGISALLAVLTLLSVSAIGASAYTLTGDQRNDIVAIAQSQVGYKEGYNNNNKYGKYFGNNYASWCAYFIVWCARQANIDSSVIKTSGYATADNLGVTYKGRPANRSTGINYTPQKGDLIIFDYKSYCYKSPASSYGDHIGIVEKVENGKVYTIEGNCNDAVRRCTYSLSNSSIKGYGVPNYKTKPSPKPSSFTVNFRMKSGAYTNAYSSYTCASKVGRVYPGDVITLKRVYSNGAAELICPWSSGGSTYNRTVYCKVSELKFKATKYINAYNPNGSYCGRVYPNDLVSLTQIYSNGVCRGLCPWSGGYQKDILVIGSQIY